MERGRQKKAWLNLAFVKEAQEAVKEAAKLHEEFKWVSGAMDKWKFEAEQEAFFAKGNEETSESKVNGLETNCSLLKDAKTNFESLKPFLVADLAEQTKEVDAMLESITKEVIQGLATAAFFMCAADLVFNQQNYKDVKTSFEGILNFGKKLNNFGKKDLPDTLVKRIDAIIALQVPLPKKTQVRIVQRIVQRPFRDGP